MSCPRNFTDGSIEFEDATGTPIVLPISLTNGFSFDNVVEGQRETVELTNRGTLTCLRYGNPIFPTISFTADVCSFVEQTTPGVATILEAITKTGDWSAATANTAEVYTIRKITFTMAQAPSDDADHTAEFRDVRATISFAENETANQFTINGTVYDGYTFA